MYMKTHYKQKGNTVTYYKGIKPLTDQDHLFIDFVKSYKSVRQMTQQKYGKKTGNFQRKTKQN